MSCITRMKGSTKINDLLKEFSQVWSTISSALLLATSETEHDYVHV